MTALSTPTLPPQAAADASDGWLIQCCERGWLPDGLVRAGMRAVWLPSGNRSQNRLRPFPFSLLC